MPKKKDGREDSEEILLAPPFGGEDDRRSYIYNWLTSIGVPASSVRAEYPTAEGSIDLYLANRRVVIEVKRGGRLERGPYAEGTESKAGESAFEQLERHLKAERARERLYLEDGVRDKNWIGAVTDCRVWYMWEWGPEPGAGAGDGRGLGDAAARINAWHGRTLDRGGIGRLARLLARGTVGREWATADMSDMFQPIKSCLDRAYARGRGLREARVQKGLWLEQLRAGGNAPESDEDDLFVLHTMLILASRMISGRGDARRGFAGWVPDEIVAEMKGVIGEYNWSQQTGDVLRALYRRYVPARHRLRYGEYYTPDWLAEIMCRTIIDDRFIGEQVRRFQSGRAVQGVLDPACGSGTFLYHAVRRILESEPVKKSYLARPDASRLACMMVRGMDIHPVAVEMARANVRRLLPNAGDEDVMIYQGDSLLMPRPEATVLGAGGSDLPLASPQGRHFVLPGWFVASDADLSRFVRSAVDDADMPDGLGSGLDGYDRGQLAESHERLRRIAREEGNGVWLWYVLNHAGSMRLRGTIGRIVANPPWVTFDKIREERQKSEVKRMAKERGLWAGGPSTKFDLAALFVDRCAELYLVEGGASGWVLPQSALRGRTWSGLRGTVGGGMTAVWDVGNLAFGSHACVMFFGADAGRKTLARRDGSAAPRDGDTWAEAERRTRWVQEQSRAAPEEQSAWTGASATSATSATSASGRGGRSPVRRGASMIPKCLVWTRTVRIGRGGGAEAEVETRESRWPPWSQIVSLRGRVPAHWVRDCISSADLAPFAVPTRTKCIVPVDGDGWDGARSKNRFWRMACDQYAAHRGAGQGTPKTLEDRINYNNGIFDQLGRRGHAVVYNKSGASLRACAIRGPDIVHDTLHYVRCASRREAAFLAGVLNSGAMQPAFRAARRNTRDFAEHIWRAVPIPRYDGRDRAHSGLADASDRAARAASAALGAGMAPRAAARAVRDALAGGGLGGRIDELCRKMLPDHAG